MTLFPWLFWGRAFLGKFSQKTTGQNLVKNPQMRGTLCERTSLGSSRVRREGESGGMVLHRETEEEIVGEFADLTAASTRSEAFDSLVELNGQCLELLADQALAQPAPGSLLLRQIGDIWRTLDAAARRRAASCPYLLVRRRILRSEPLAVVARAARARAGAGAVCVILHGAARIGGCAPGVYLCVASGAIEEHGGAVTFGHAPVLHEPHQLMHVAADP